MHARGSLTGARGYWTADQARLELTPSSLPLPGRQFLPLYQLSSSMAPANLRVDRIKVKSRSRSSFVC